MLTKQTLTSWNWRDAADASFAGRLDAPTTNIHLDLLAAGLIPDPFVGQNEADLQWIQHKTWVYTTNFKAAPVATEELADLVFEGLDTFATVKLNGSEILRTENMFIGHRVDVRHLLKPENELEITFESAYDKGEALRAKYGDRICWNGHYGRIYVRKAQYHFGWDWGPSFMTCGPWKPVSLERYTSRIDDIHVDIDLADDFTQAVLKIAIDVEPKVEHHSVEVELKRPDGSVISTTQAVNGSTSIPVTQPQLWYPHTHGAQPLYQLQVWLRSAAGRVLHTKAQTIGFRRVELIQDPLKEGTSFYFRVNGIPIFAGGSNWIPGDNFLPRMTPDRYKRWIEIAVRGNQNMIRIWGGGIYEDDAFYAECDRQGVLVWQDFLFACGNYPTDKWFIDSVTEEAAQNIRRLRSHPSLAIWAGNNEDYQVANEGLKHDMQMPEEQWAKSTFGARVTYERTLPDLVQKYSPGAIYWPGSPFGGVDNNSDRTIGDVHIWNVSSGMLLPYQRYPDVPARFISEFGMISCPSVATVKETFFGDDEDQHVQSKSFEFHNKAHGYEKRMFTCIGESVRMSFELEPFVYLSQLVQGEAMYYAYRGWRRLFEGRECGGTLVWQLGDSWPVTSWAIVDHFERPKMAYYTIARAMRNVGTGISRKLKVNPRPNHQHEAFCNGKIKADAAGVIAHATPHIYPKRESIFSVWIANATTDIQTLKSRVRFISIKTGKEVRDAVEQIIEAKATGTTDIISDAEGPEAEPTVIVSEIYDANGVLVSHDVDWPQPLKHLTFPDRELKVEVRGEDLIISAARPVKGLWFTNVGVHFSDNALDVVPGQKLRVVAPGLQEGLQWRYYGM
ncbi:uncharacterized protein E0L32_003891 [Thyridium curvatum]|uniref:Beta-mannosidase B n=1 Tax=Thyridium curvatum TaxID=1093900 RepID=A0A507B1T6_9PEZI|nr:uncharacterized protein E0L32_003891 [Thyridium curvatum]TPX16242.1 hypothetical protein E0L32_003891 [Thyridium curvatum]